MGRRKVSQAEWKGMEYYALMSQQVAGKIKETDKCQTFSRNS